MSGSMLNIRRPAIAPSILTADFGRLREEIEDAESAGVDLIHLDVMDGHFVPNISFGPLLVSSVRKMTRLPLDVHLMIEEPERYIDAFVEAGADVITVHAEATPHPHRAIQKVKSQDVYAGIAINPATPLSAVEELVTAVDLVLIMTVNPGFGGQTFIPESVDKVRRLKEMLNVRGLDRVRIEVDGGIKASTILEPFKAGADVFVAGSSVYNDDQEVSEAVATLRAATYQS